MARFGCREQLQSAAVPVELSTLSTMAHGSSQKDPVSDSERLKRGGSETELLTEQPLLTLAQVCMQTRAAQKERGMLAVAPALEPYIGATHYRRSGEAVPSALKKAVVLDSRARVYKNGPLSILPSVFCVAFYGLFGAFFWGSAGSRDCHEGDLPWYQRLLFVAVGPALIAMPLLAASALAALDRAPFVLVPTAWGFINNKAELVVALYFLYCEDKCRHGRSDEAVHKVIYDRSIYTVHGDGHMTLHVLPPPRRNR